MNCNKFRYKVSDAEHLLFNPYLLTHYIATPTLINLSIRASIGNETMKTHINNILYNSKSFTSDSYMTTTRKTMYKFAYVNVVVMMTR